MQPPVQIRFSSPAPFPQGRHSSPDMRPDRPHSPPRLQQSEPLPPRTRMHESMPAPGSPPSSTRSHYRPVQTPPQMSHADEMRIQESLRDQIMDLIHAIYGPQNPRHHSFSVLPSRHFAPTSSNPTRELIIIKAVVYTRPNFGKWRIIKQGSRVSESVTAAYHDFLVELEREFALMTGEERVYTWKEAWGK